MTSATYQLADTDETNVKDDRYYSHHLTRRLPAEVILDAFSQVDGQPTRSRAIRRARARCSCPIRGSSRISTVFGRPERILTSMLPSGRWTQRCRRPCTRSTATP